MDKTDKPVNQWNDWQRLRKRGRRIIKLRAKGLSWSDIGDKVGCTKQAAWQSWQAIKEGRGPYAGLL